MFILYRGADAEVITKSTCFTLEAQTSRRVSQWLSLCRNAKYETSLASCLGRLYLQLTEQAPVEMTLDPIQNQDTQDCLHLGLFALCLEVLQDLQSLQISRVCITFTVIY